MAFIPEVSCFSENYNFQNFLWGIVTVKLVYSCPHSDNFWPNNTTAHAPFWEILQQNAWNWLKYMGSHFTQTASLLKMCHKSCCQAENDATVITDCRFGYNNKDSLGYTVPRHTLTPRKYKCNPLKILSFKMEEEN